ncbi:MAG: DUF1667 domain-containing protein [Treponema sp.]|nr:DUF1667 domain-containing protein [Treponema sp.]
MDRDIICIVCPVGCRLKVSGTIEDLKVNGQRCEKGLEYAKDEISNPMRMICTTVRINGGIHPVLPVKTDRAISEKYKLDVVKEVNKIQLNSPVKMGDVIISDLFGTGVNIVAERDM